jgi:protein-arginine kinase activator protein McsA
MKTMKVLIPALLVSAGLLVNTSASWSKPAFAKETGQKCTACHTDMKTPKQLNKAGECYKTKKDWKACAA